MAQHWTALATSQDSQATSSFEDSGVISEKSSYINSVELSIQKTLHTDVTQHFEKDTVSQSPNHSVDGTVSSETMPHHNHTSSSFSDTPFPLSPIS